MAEENQNLTGSFAAAAQTGELLQQLQKLNQRLSCGAEERKKKAPRNDMEYIWGLAQAEVQRLAAECVKIVENQQLQNVRMDALEKRLAGLEGGGFVRLDKAAARQQTPKN